MEEYTFSFVINMAFPAKRILPQAQLFVHPFSKVSSHAESLSIPHISFLSPSSSILSYEVFPS